MGSLTRFIAVMDFAQRQWGWGLKDTVLPAAALSQTTRLYMLVNGLIEERTIYTDLSEFASTELKDQARNFPNYVYALTTEGYEALAKVGILDRVFEDYETELRKMWQIAKRAVGLSVEQMLYHLAPTDRRVVWRLFVINALALADDKITVTDEFGTVLTGE